MNKQLLSFLLTLLMSMVGTKSFAHDFAVANDDGVTIYYKKIINSKEVAVSYRGSNYYNYQNTYSGNVVIPASVEYKGTIYSVTSIEGYAFSSCIGLISVVIPSTVTNIGEYAFGGCGLTSITIPQSVTYIGRNPFSASSLNSIVVEDNNTFYDSRNNCNAIINTKTNTLIVGCKNTIIPNSVTSIEYRAFYGCSDLTSITIPSSVTRIRYGAFYGCSDLSSVTINSNTIVSNTYSQASNLTSIFGTQVKNYIIGDDVTSIGCYAFYDCTNLNSITISKSVTSIDDCAFILFPQIGFSFIFLSSTPPIYSLNFLPNSYNYRICVPSESVDLYKDAANWRIYAERIRSIPFNRPEDPQPSNEIWYTTKKEKILNPNNVDAFSSTLVYNIYVNGVGIMEFDTPITSIGNKTFYKCTDITSITIPEGVTSIGREAFSCCSGLTFVAIPNRVTSIGNSSFYGCSSLTSITIPNSVTSIGYSAFSGCSGLTSITISESVSSIGDSAFLGCESLDTIYVNSNAIVSKTYSQEANFKTIFGAQVKEYIIGDDVTSIGDYAFSGCNGLTSITLPNRVTSIGDYAFYDCNCLTSVTIGNSVTSIGDHAFEGCKDLNTVFLNCSAVGGWFAGNTNIKKVVLGESVQTIELRAFQGCVGLSSITISEGVTSIGHEAFYGCYDLSSVTIPSSVTSIGAHAFYDCVNVSDVYCFADPSNLSWNSYDDFKANKETKCHVSASVFDAYQTKFGGVSVTFVGDLTLKVESVVAGKQVNDDVFDLNGRRLEGQLKKGIYIKNGRKYIER